MIRLRGITWDHPRGRAPLEETAGLYAERFGVQVEWSARSLKDFGDAPIDALAEQYDLIILDHPHLGVALTEASPLLALNEHLDARALRALAEQSAGPSHASYTLGGRQWGLAIDGAMQASALRRDLLDVEVPRDWEEAMRLGAEMAGGDAKMAIPLAACDAVCSFISICAGRGGMNEPEERFVEREVGLEGLELLRRLKEVAHPRSVEWNPIHLFDHMSTANDVAYCPLSFCYTNYSRAGFRPRRIEFGAIPQASGSILGGAGFAVSARCEHPAEACAYGAWLCSAEVQRGLYVRYGGQPGNIEAWKDAAADELTGGFFSGTREVIERAFVRPRHLGWPAFQEWAGNVIRDMLMAGTSAEACLDSLEEGYRRSLEVTSGGEEP